MVLVLFNTTLAVDSYDGQTDSTTVDLDLIRGLQVLVLHWALTAEDLQC